jgi:hydrogenase maturation factor
VDECLVHPAKVRGIYGSRLTLMVRYPRISKTKNGLELPKKKFYEKEVVNFSGDNIEIGDYVTIHFSTAVEKINTDEFGTLLKITHLSLRAFNKKHSRGAKYHHAFLNVPNK